MKIMTGNKQEEKLQFKSNDTFYTPSGGPNRFPQRAAAGGWKPQNYKPRFNFNSNNAGNGQLRAGGGGAKLQIDIKKNPFKNGKVMLCNICGAYTHLRAECPHNPALYMEGP